MARILSSFTESDGSDLSMENPSSSDFGLSREVHGFEDQILRHQDGTVFNLSSIDLNYVNVYYEYETVNVTMVDDEIVSPGRVVALVVFALILVTGLVGNGLIVFTVARYLMKHATNLLLLNLSVANILYLVVCLPALSVSYATVDWRFGRVFCKLENYAMSVSMVASAWTIMATGLDRYLTTVYPDRYRAFRTVKTSVVLISCIWVTSFAAMAPRIPLFEESAVFHKIGAVTLCSRDASTKILRIDTVLIVIFVYMLPLFINLLCSYRVWRKSRNTNVLSLNQNGKLTGKIFVRERRTVAKIVFAIAIVFAVGWFPVHLYHLIEDFDEGNVFLGEFIDRGTVALLFSFGANSFNPILIFSLSSCFRGHLKTSFKCICCKFLASNISIDLESGSSLVSQEKTQIYRKNSSFISRPGSSLSETLLPFKGGPTAISSPGES